MKRILATVLAGCLVLQPLSGYTLTVRASEQTTPTLEDVSETTTEAAGMGNTEQENKVPDAPQSEGTGQQSGTADVPAADVFEPSQQGGTTIDPSSGTGMQEAVPGDGSFDVSGPDIVGDDMIADDGFSMDEIVAVDEIAGDTPGDHRGHDPGALPRRVEQLLY